MADLETLVVRFVAEMGELNKAFEEVGNKVDEVAKEIAGKFESIGDALEGAGKKLSLAITAPVAAMSALAVAAADTQIQAEEKLGAAITAAGEDAEAQLPILKEYASALQSVTTVGDETTLANMQMARSLGLSAQESVRASKNAIALSRAFGVNEKAGIRMTAMLEQGNTSMLSRYFPTLRSLSSESERAAEAQRLLAQAFSLATREAEVGLGPWRQLSNDIGDVYEEFGKVILEAINPFIKRARVLVLRLGSMSEETKKMILIVSGIAAAVGPGLIALGLFTKAIGAAISGLGLLAKTVTMTFSIVSSTMAALATVITSPITLTVVAIASVVAAFLLFQRTVTQIGQSVGRIVDELFIQRIMPAVEFFGDALSEINTVAKQKFGELVKQFILLKNGMVSIGSAIILALKDKLLGGFNNTILRPLATLLSGAIETMLSGLPSLIRDRIGKIEIPLPAKLLFAGAKRAVATAFEGIKGQLQSDMALVSRVFTEEGNKIRNAFGDDVEDIGKNIDKLKEKAKELGAKLQAGFKKGKSAIEEFTSGTDEDVDEILKKLEELGLKLPETVGKAATEAEKNLKDLTKGLKDFTNNVKRPVREASEEVQGWANDLGSSFSRAFDDALIGGERFRDILGSLEQDIMRIFVRRAITAPIVGALFGTPGGGGGLFQNLFSAKGNVFRDGHRVPFRKGGLVKGETTFPLASGIGTMGEGGSTEGIFPIGRTGSGELGVKAIGDMGSKPKVEVNVYAPPGSEVEQEQEQIGDMTKIHVMIDQATARNMKTPGTNTSRALKDTFGIAPTTLGR